MSEPKVTLKPILKALVINSLKLYFGCSNDSTFDIRVYNPAKYNGENILRPEQEVGNFASMTPENIADIITKDIS